MSVVNEEAPVNLSGRKAGAARKPKRPMAEFGKALVKYLAECKKANKTPNTRELALEFETSQQSVESRLKNMREKAQKPEILAILNSVESSAAYTEDDLIGELTAAGLVEAA